MKQFVGIYRFTKLVRNQINDLEREMSSTDSLSGFQGAHAVTLIIKQKYVAKYRKTTMPKANYVCVDAIKNGYLEPETYGYKGKTIDALCLTTKGRKLLDRPIGTFQEFLGEYGLVASFLSGGLVVAIVGATLQLL